MSIGGALCTSICRLGRSLGGGWPGFVVECSVLLLVALVEAGEGPGQRSSVERSILFHVSPAWGARGARPASVVGVISSANCHPAESGGGVWLASAVGALCSAIYSLGRSGWACIINVNRSSALRFHLLPWGWWLGGA